MHIYKNYNEKFRELGVQYPNHDKIRAEVEREYLNGAHIFASVGELQRAVNDEASRRFHDQLSKYRDAERERNTKFQQQVLEDCGLSDLPQDIQDKAFSYAWQEGHSCGYNEVASYLEEIADLVIAAYEAGKNSKN